MLAAAPPAAAQEKPQPPDSLMVGAFSVRHYSDYDDCDLEIRYPQIVDEDGDPYDDTIDFPALTAINTEICRALMLAPETILEQCEPLSVKRIDYEVHYNRDGWLSLIIETRVIDRFGGGEDIDAMIFQEAFHFNFLTGKRLLLSNMMQGNYVEALQVFLQRALVARGYEDATPFVEDDTAFYREGDNLVFIIDIETPPEHVAIPFKAVKEFLTEDVPLRHDD